MRRQILLQPGFILHTKAYRDSSFILTIFTKEYGLIKLMAKGARRIKSKLRSQLQFFTPTKISYIDKESLGLLTNIELCARFNTFSSEKLVFGLYINELMVKLLHEHDPHPNLFDIYEDILTKILRCENIEIVLREFEILLLKEVGYGIDFFKDFRYGNAIVTDEEYFFDIENGFEKKYSPTGSKRIFFGRELLQIGFMRLTDGQVLRDAKYILRKVVDQRLGKQKINSRKLIIM